MTLSTTVKNAVNALSASDKALLLAYILGVDDPGVVSKAADAFVRTYYPQHQPDALTGDQRALGMLRQVYAYMRSVYRNDMVQDAETMRQIAMAKADAEIAAARPLEKMPS